MKSEETETLDEELEDMAWRKAAYEAFLRDDGEEFRHSGLDYLQAFSSVGNFS